jgi:putative N6-adenine-specific DNA methylase
MNSTVRTPRTETSETFFAPCPKGLSGVLADELRSFGAEEVREEDAGCAFRGPLSLVPKVNLGSRIASRILWQQAHFQYRKEQDVYDAVKAINWPERFAVSCTIKVETNANRCPLKSLDFITLRIKDAVCDRFRDAQGSRPSVATREPDVRVHAFLDPTHCWIYLDTSGEPLFKRGTRDHVGAAPLKKNLAAGILKLTGWQPGMPLLDPMCGSGTFLVEAAEMALNRLPGRERPFGFEKLKGFDAARIRALREEAKAAELPARDLQLFGADMYGDALKDARANLLAAGLGDAVHLKQANVLELPAPAEGGVMLTNPPYGVRIGEQEALREMYPKLGDALKQKFAGWTCYFFTADTALAKGMRLSPSRKTPLFNGKLECRLYQYKIVAGSNRKEAPTEG